LPFVHKLLNLHEYHRPARRGEGIAAALDLLARPGIRTAVIAGGDTLLASGDPAIEAVVDLQGLGLDRITAPHKDGLLQIGALVTRAALAAWGAGSESGSLIGLLAAAAHRWGGSVQRNRATVGGAVATAAADDPLVAALLACDAEVVLAERGGERMLPIADFLPRRAAILAAPAIITGLRVPAAALAVAHGFETVARTPADAPIVLAVAGLTVEQGRSTRGRLVIGGAAAAPMRIVEAEALLEGTPLSEEAMAAAAERAAAAVEPAGDFRGSAEYRRAMVKVLAQRALASAARGARRGAN
jgi:CO/xanthine dehydrogenase FAD-binding subunit